MARRMYRSWCFNTRNCQLTPLCNLFTVEFSTLIDLLDTKNSWKYYIQVSCSFCWLVREWFCWKFLTRNLKLILVSCNTDGITENWTFPCFVPILSGFFSFYWRILSKKVSKLTSLTWALPYSEGINTWSVQHVNFLQWKFDPYQFFWYKLFVFRFPTDEVPRFL